MFAIANEMTSQTLTAPLITSSPTVVGSRLSANSPVFGPNLSRPATSSPTSIQFDHDMPGVPSLVYDGTKALSYRMSTGEGIRLQPRPSICREDRGRGGRGVVVTSSSESNCAVTVSTPRAVNNNNIKLKTEWCQNLSKPGGCPFGENCHFIHHEWERRSTGVVPLWPCLLALSTGHW